MSMQGTWRFVEVEGAHVRLVNGQTGLGTIEVSAPVTGGQLVVDVKGISLSLQLALSRLKSTNMLMQMAAKSLISGHGSTQLDYLGTGPSAEPWAVVGPAVAGDVRMEIALTITPLGGATAQEIREIDLKGTHRLGAVNLPFPGMGRIDDFSFDVDARLAVQFG